MQLLKEMIRTKKARQKATEAATEDLKNDFVNKILGYDVQKKYEEILGSKGLFSDNAMMVRYWFRWSSVNNWCSWSRWS